MERQEDGCETQAPAAMVTGMEKTKEEARLWKEVKDSVLVFVKFEIPEVRLNRQLDANNPPRDLIWESPIYTGYQSHKTGRD